MRGSPWAWAAAVLWTSTFAVPAGAEPAANTVQSVTVTPEAPLKDRRKRVEAFVGRIAPHPYGAALTRWHDPICPLVSGMTQPQGEAVLARITEAARAVGAPVATSERCRPNLYVVVHADPRALLAAWRARDRELFGALDGPAIDRLIAADRPARAWHDWADQSDRGMFLDRDSHEYGGAPQVRFANQSRILASTQRNTYGAVVVLDSRRLAGLTVGQIADYVAMAALAEVDLDAPPGDAPSILNLFRTDGGPRPEGLSDWDQAFLKALYRVPQAFRQEPAQVARQAAEAVTR